MSAPEAPTVEGSTSAAPRRSSRQVAAVAVAGAIGVLEGWQLSHPDAGSPQGGVVTASGEHLSTRGRGPVVREGRAAAAARSRLHGPVRGRSGPGLQQRAGCASGMGRPATTLWQVRPHSPPHQDPTALIPAQWVGQGAEGRHEETELRLSGGSPTIGNDPGAGSGW